MIRLRRATLATVRLALAASLSDALPLRLTASVGGRPLRARVVTRPDGSEPRWAFTGSLTGTHSLCALSSTPQRVLTHWEGYQAAAERAWARALGAQLGHELARGWRGGDA